MHKRYKKLLATLILIVILLTNNSTLVLATEAASALAEEPQASTTEQVQQEVQSDTSSVESITQAEESSSQVEASTGEVNNTQTSLPVENNDVISDVQIPTNTPETNIDVTPTEEAAPVKATEDKPQAVVEEEKTTTDAKSTDLPEEPDKSNIDEENTTKKEETEEDKVNKPAVEFFKETEGTSVFVHADAEIFPEGTEMKIEKVPQEQIYDVVNDAIPENVSKIVAVDITFWYEGKEIQPESPISVTIKTNEIKDETAQQLVHIDDEKKVDVVNDAKITQVGQEVNAEFDASQFSVYAVVTTDDDGNEVQSVFYRTYNFFDINSSDTYEEYEFQTESGKTLTSQKIKDGDKLIDVGSPYHAGHTFLGWFLEGEEGRPGNTQVTFGSEVELNLTQDESVNVYAKYDGVYYVFFQEYEQGSSNKSVLTTKITDNQGNVKISDVLSSTTADNKVFLGWIDGDTTHKIYDDNNQIKETTIQVSEDTNLYPYFEVAYWLRFISGEVGSGASYIEAKFVLATQTINNLEVPTRDGYSFDGWFDKEDDTRVTDGTGAVTIEGGLQLSSDKVLEAHWNANQDSEFKVIYWLQKETDDKAATDSQKKYDYWKMDTKNSSGQTLKGATGQDPTTTSDYLSLDAEGQNTSELGARFHYARTEINNGGVINANGSTVVNVYYDRDLIIINFYYNNGSQPQGQNLKPPVVTAYNYTETTSNAGNTTYYGVHPDGTYVELTRHEGESTQRVAYVYGYNQTEYTGTFCTRTGNLLNYSYPETQYNGNNLPPAGDNTTYYTSSGQELTRTTITETEYTYTYTLGGVEYTYTGPLYTRLQNNQRPYMVTFTGLSGQSFDMYGYTYPITYSWSDGTYSQTLLTAFTKDITSNNVMYNLNQTGYQGTSVIYHYKQALDGKYCQEENVYRFTAHSSGNNFTFSNKFEGFTAYRFDTDRTNHNGYHDTLTNSNSYSCYNNSGNFTSTRASGHSGEFPLHIYHTRNQNNVIYRYNGNEVKTISNVYYEAELTKATYDISAEEAGISIPDHYYFDGWCADEALTKPFEFSTDDEKVTMPDANVVLYAKISPIDYKISIDPAGGVITSDIGSTYFWRGYHTDKIKRYNGVERNFIADDNGQYKYVYYDGSEYANYDDPLTGAPRTATYELIGTDENYTGQRYRPITDEDPTYTLVGWYEVLSNGEISPTPYDFDSREIEGNITLRAVWRVGGTYQVIYEPSGYLSDGVRVDGQLTESYNTELVTFSDSAETIALQAPTYDHEKFVFNGWEVVNDSIDNTGAAGTDVYDNNDGSYYKPGNTITINSSDWSHNHKIYIRAHYSKVDESDNLMEETFIKFNTNGGNFIVDKEALLIPAGSTPDMNEDKTLFTVSNLTVNANMRTYGKLQVAREGYELQGWSINPSSETAEFKCGQTIGIDNLDPTDNTVYAVWRQLDWLYYDKNDPDATGTMDPTEGYANGIVKVAACGFTKLGSTFTGWTRLPSSSTPVAYQSGDDYQLTDGEDILYAQWSKDEVTYIVKHYVKCLDNNTTDFDYEFDNGDKYKLYTTVVRNSSTETHPIYVGNTEYGYPASYTGYTFNETATKNAAEKEDASFNIAWDEAKNALSGTVKVGPKVNGEWEPLLELKLFYDRETYYIHYHLVDHVPTKLTEEDLTYPKEPVPALFGSTVTVAAKLSDEKTNGTYEFKGWSETIGGTPVETIASMPNNDIHLYGKFFPVEESASIRVIRYEEIISLPENVSSGGVSGEPYTHGGYTYTKYNASENPSTTYISVNDGTETRYYRGTITPVNKLAPLEFYTVESSTEQPEKYAVSYETTLHDPDNNYVHHHFHYDDDNNPEPHDVPNEVTENNGVVTVKGEVFSDNTTVLSMYYNLKEYTITYRYKDSSAIKPNEDEVTTWSHTVKVGAEQVLNEVEEVPGYTFHGWENEQGATITSKEVEGNTVQVLGPMVANNVVLEGYYTGNNSSYLIEHYAVVVNGETADITVDGVGYKKIPDADITREGTVGGPALYNVDTIEGFEYSAGVTRQYYTEHSDEEITLNDTGKTITGTVKVNNDGEPITVLRTFYTRVTHTIHYYLTGYIPTQYDPTDPNYKVPDAIENVPYGTIIDKASPLADILDGSGNILYEFKGHTAEGTDIDTWAFRDPTTITPVVAGNYDSFYMPNRDVYLYGYYYSGQENETFYYVTYYVEATGNEKTDASINKDGKWYNVLPDDYMEENGKIKDGKELRGYFPVPSLNASGNVVTYDNVSIAKYSKISADGYVINKSLTEKNYTYSVEFSVEDPNAPEDPENPDAPKPYIDVNEPITTTVSVASNNMIVVDNLRPLTDPSKTPNIEIYYDKVEFNVNYIYSNNIRPDGAPIIETLPYYYHDVVTVAETIDYPGYYRVNDSVWHITNANAGNNPDKIVDITGDDPNRTFIMPSREVNIYIEYGYGDLTYESHHYVEIIAGDQSKEDFENNPRYKIIEYDNRVFVWDSENPELTRTYTTSLDQLHNTNQNIQGNEPNDVSVNTLQLTGYPGIVLYADATNAHITSENENYAEGYKVTATTASESTADNPKISQKASIFNDETGTGTRVFDFVYERKPYTIRYDIVGHIPHIIVGHETEYGKPTGDYVGEKPYQKQITVAPDMLDIEGYTFKGWRLLSTTGIDTSTIERDEEGFVTAFKMPSRNVFLEGYYEATEKVPYYLNLYLETANPTNSSIRKELVDENGQYILDDNGEKIVQYYDLTTITMEDYPMKDVEIRETQEISTMIANYDLNVGLTLNDTYNKQPYELVTRTYNQETGEISTKTEKIYTTIVKPSGTDNSTFEFIGKVLADETLTVSAYFDLKEFTVTYNLVNAEGLDVPPKPKTKPYKNSSTVNVEPDLELDGYDFVGWNPINAGLNPRDPTYLTINTETNPETFTMPARPVTLQGSFNPHRTSYTVNHYVENLPGVTTLKEGGMVVNGHYYNIATPRETYSYQRGVYGIKDVYVGDTVGASSIPKVPDLTLDGYTLNKADTIARAGEVGNTYEEDGDNIDLSGVAAIVKVGDVENPTLVFDFFYTRNNYEYTINYKDKDTGEAIETAPSVTNQAIFGSEVKASDYRKDDIGGYVWDSYSADSIQIGSNPSNNVIDILYTKRADINYTINYIDVETQQPITLDGNRPNPKTAQATFKQVITAENKKITIDGYNYDHPDKDQIEIVTDETQNVINLYYTKRADINYTVNYIDVETQQPITLDGNRPNPKTAQATFKQVITAESEKITIAGYHYDHPDKDQIEIVTDETQNVLNLYYTKRTDIKYTVNFVEKNNEDNVLHTPISNNAKYLSTITGRSQVIAIPGYYYDSCSPTSITIYTDESRNIITLYYTKRNDIKYTVEYYYQVEGAYLDTPDFTDDTRRGTTDATVYITDDDKIPVGDGYVYDESAPNVESGPIAIDESLVLKVYFKQQLTITSSVDGGNGTITPDGETEYDYGNNGPYTFAPDEGYTIKSLLVDGNEQTVYAEPRTELLSEGYTFEYVTEDHTIVVRYGEDENDNDIPDDEEYFTITSSVDGGNGTIDPEGDNEYVYGSDAPYTFAPDEGYTIKSLLLDNAEQTTEGEPRTALLDNGYTFEYVTDNHTIVVKYSEDENNNDIPDDEEYFTITSSVDGGNGTIDPEGNNEYVYGSDAPYTFAPDDGYTIKSLLVDNAEQTTEGEPRTALLDNGYTFEYVTDNHTIVVKYSTDENDNDIPDDEEYFTITSSVYGGNGTITPEGETSVPYGDDQAFVFEASEGYTIKSLLVDGEEQTTEGEPRTTLLSEGYTFEYVTDDHTIVVKYSEDRNNNDIPDDEENHYIITATAEENGSVDPEGESDMIEGESLTISITPDEGYTIKSLTIDNEEQTTEGESREELVTNGYTFENITADHTLNVTFAKDDNNNNIPDDEEPFVPVEHDPPVKKIIKGDAPETAATFRFELEAIETTAEGVKEMPMPEGSNGSKKTIDVVGSGEYEFGIITFEVPGTYTYRITEKALGTVGYKYDGSTYTVTYIVEEEEMVEAGRKLVCDRTITKDGKEVTECVFTNEYTKPASATPGESPNLGGGQTVVAPAGFVKTGDNAAIYIIILAMALFSFAISFKVEPKVEKTSKKIYK